MHLRPRLTALSATVAAIPLVLAAAAFACTNLATLTLSSSDGHPGDTITVSGSSFVPVGDGQPSPVVLQWDRVDGAVVGTATPDAAGNISATFSVPDGEPGYHVIIATQRDAAGRAQNGSPARASFQIQGANPASVGHAGTVGSTPMPSGDDASAAVIAFTVALGALGVGLLGAGFVAALRQPRRRAIAAPVPAPAPRR